MTAGAQAFETRICRVSAPAAREMLLRTSCQWGMLLIEDLGCCSVTLWTQNDVRRGDFEGRPVLRTVPYSVMQTGCVCLDIR